MYHIVIVTSFCIRVSPLSFSMVSSTLSYMEMCRLLTFPFRTALHMDNALWTRQLTIDINIPWEPVGGCPHDVVLVLFLFLGEPWQLSACPEILTKTETLE